MVLDGPSAFLMTTRYPTPNCSFVVLLSCSRATLLPNAGAEYCVDSTTGFRVIAALEWFLELIAMALPIYGFYLTPNPWKYIKTLIWMVLVRVPNIVLSVVHILFYSKFMNERQSAIDIVPTFIWAIILLTYNLISATLPSLMKLTKIFGTQGVAVGNFDSQREAAGTNSETNHSLANLGEHRAYPPSTCSRQSEQHLISSRQCNP
ncbi:hypothetical protein J3E72DRAFT_273757 [Bipolaris maydis]|nr:hypothetical protein J3E72DRAFT_273757 [Bipolaris maydis]